LTAGWHLSLRRSKKKLAHFPSVLVNAKRPGVRQSSAVVRPGWPLNASKANVSNHSECCDRTEKTQEHSRSGFHAECFEDADDAGGKTSQDGKAQDG